MSTQQSVYKRTCTQRKLTFGGSINVWLVSSLTGSDSTKQEIMSLFVWSQSWPVKQETIWAVILPLPSECSLVYLPMPVWLCWEVVFLLYLPTMVDCVTKWVFLGLPTYAVWLCYEVSVPWCTYLCCLIVLLTECSLVYLPMLVDCVTKWVFLGLPTYAGWLC